MYIGIDALLDEQLKKVSDLLFSPSSFRQVTSGTTKPHFQFCELTGRDNCYPSFQPFLFHLLLITLS